ncbi:protein of unknown function [Methylocaldum szegediense]|uniref:Uncharacterized protein n=1 Tax=Methylocaldum szegediense TaxID=73780 RepID=A0ABM9HWT9_9GAMM|nr:protein of unknown function [Methylocaldum szegediense]
MLVVASRHIGSAQLLSYLSLADYTPTATTERMTEFEEGTQSFFVSILSWATDRLRT